MRFSRSATLRLLALVCLLLQPGIRAMGETSEIRAIAENEGKTRLLEGNSIVLLDDGQEAFDQRMRLIRSAQHHILISTFIWRDDESGQEVVQAIREQIQLRKKQGAKLRVLVILDGATAVASLDVEGKIRHSLKKAGAHVRILHPMREGLQPFYMTRLHDKVMIVDGKAAILGGRNYSDHYFRNTGDIVWYDADIRLEGPAVEDLQMHWLKMWCVLKRLARIDRFFSPPEKTLNGIRHFWKHGRFPNGDSPLDAFAKRQWFPYQKSSGSLRAGILYDNPMVWELAPTLSVLHSLIIGAEREIDIVTPFPNFTSEILQSLEDAAERGVRVRILTNSEKRALRGGPYWKVLLPAILRLSKAGVQFWGWSGPQDEEIAVLEKCHPLRRPYTGLHAKYLQVDGQVAIVSASNFNLRSAHYNTEAGVLVADPGFAVEVRNRVDRLVGAIPFSLECSDGEELILQEPSLPFDADRLKHFRKELGSNGGRFEAYGPVF